MYLLFLKLARLASKNWHFVGFTAPRHGCYASERGVNWSKNHLKTRPKQHKQTFNII